MAVATAASGTKRFEPFTQAAPSCSSTSATSTSSMLAAAFSVFSRTHHRGLVDGVAADHRGAAGEGRHAPIEGLGVAFDHDHVLGLTPSWSATICANTVSWPWPWLRGRYYVDLAGDRVDADMAALVGAEAGAFDIAGKPEAEIFASARAFSCSAGSSSAPSASTIIARPCGTGRCRA